MLGGPATVMRDNTMVTDAFSGPAPLLVGYYDNEASRVPMAIEDNLFQGYTVFLANGPLVFAGNTVVSNRDDNGGEALETDNPGDDMAIGDNALAGFTGGSGLTCVIDGPVLGQPLHLPTFVDNVVDNGPNWVYGQRPYDTCRGAFTLNNGNRELDPGFVTEPSATRTDETADLDPHPASGSPLVDTGTPAVPGLLSLPATDLIGSPRVVDGNGDGRAKVDIGAYEKP